MRSPERVLTEDDFKIYNVNGEVFIFDDQHDLDYSQCQVTWINPIFLVNDTGDAIGTAVLELVGTKLLAELMMDYQTPERLSIETKGMPYFPHLIHESVVTEGDAGKYVSEMTIEKLMLSIYPVSDLRIEAL